MVKTRNEFRYSKAGKMFRRKQHQANQRTRHPDPAVEARLQHLIMLYDRIKSKQDQSQEYSNQIANLQQDILNLTDRSARANSSYKHSSMTANDVRAECAKLMAGHDQRIKNLQSEIRQIDADIDAIFETIAAKQENLNDSDLAYLYPPSS